MGLSEATGSIVALKVGCAKLSPGCRPVWWFSGCVMVCLLQVQRQTSRLLKSTLWFWMPIVLSLLIQSWVLRPMRLSGWDTVRLCCRWGLRFRLGWCGCALALSNVIPQEDPTDLRTAVWECCWKISVLLVFGCVDRWWKLDSLVK